jgi:Effector Associated Constant Component 1
VAEVVMNVRLPSVDPGHSAFQVALAEFLEDLSTVPPLRPRQRDLPADGAFKGPMTELVVSVSTSGGVAALVKIMRIWLGRDRKRSLKVTVQTAENKTTYEISGEDVSVETLRDALEAAVRTQTASDPDSA